MTAVGWEKLGHVFVADGFADWACSHAYVPTPLLLDRETIRVYAAFLDADRIGRVGFVDVAAADPRLLIRHSEKPVLGVGHPGSFDEDGVTPSAVIAGSDEIRLYYFGWRRGDEHRYTLFGGLALSSDGGASFARATEEPVFPSASGERVCRSAPAVLQEEETWRAWYVSSDAWTVVGGRDVPTYGIRTAESADGVEWTSPGVPSLEPSHPDEYGLGRPFVVRGDFGYRMWYSIRTRSLGYRIGYATSVDGVVWQRRDEEVGLDVSSSGWDSEMVCFAAVLKTMYGTYMFYNGNNYGETGFGVAVLRMR